jgi:ABC-type lipoprotein release transport system permease subunit
MHRIFDIAATGLTAVLMHPVRSLVTVIAVVAVLVPYLSGLGIARGVQDDALESVVHGADLYVTGEQFGRPVPMPADAADEIRGLPGVADAAPRIVGRIELGKERVSAVVVGVALAHLPSNLECIDGRLYGGGSRNELVIGSDLARRLNLKVGSLLPPFYRSRSGEHVSEIVGIFRSDVSYWQARLIVTSFETAARIFDQPGMATDVIVYCQPGYEADVRTAILRDPSLAGKDGGPRPRVMGRDESAARVSQDPVRREGTLTLLSVIAFAVAVLVVLVTSGFGLSERRREVGILKAMGWQTDELLLRSLVESLTLGIVAASAAIVLAYLWLECLNGYGIAGVFLSGADLAPGFRVPFRMTPGPVLLTVLVSLIVVNIGSLHATWRSAIAPPRETMR